MEKPGPRNWVEWRNHLDHQNVDFYNGILCQEVFPMDHYTQKGAISDEEEAVVEGTTLLACGGL